MKLPLSRIQIEYNTHTHFTWCQWQWQGLFIIRRVNRGNYMRCQCSMYSMVKRHFVDAKLSVRNRRNDVTWVEIIVANVLYWVFYVLRSSTSRHRDIANRNAFCLFSITNVVFLRTRQILRVFVGSANSIKHVILYFGIGKYVRQLPHAVSKFILQRWMYTYTKPYKLTPAALISFVPYSVSFQFKHWTLYQFNQFADAIYLFHFRLFVWTMYSQRVTVNKTMNG